MKKLFALLLAAIMVISMAACAPADDSTTTTGAAEDTKAPAATTTAAADDTTAAEAPNPWNTYDYFDLTGITADNKINIGLPVNATITDYDDNDLTKYLEELTGIDIEFTFFSSDSDERKQQLNLMVANREKLPDVLYGMVDSALATEYGEQGLLCDITPFLEKSARLNAYLDTMNEYELNYFWARVPDVTTGEIYHVPSPSINNGVDSQEWIGAISKTMAANVGMDAAEIDTIDEVYEYLTKTVKEDGNGNGKADEVGLIYRQNGYRTNAELWIINAYVFCQDTYMYNATDGEIWLPYNTDEYRQAMITMNKWYKEGLISPLSYSLKDDAEQKALVDVGPGNYTVVAWGGHPTLVCAPDSQIGYDYTNVNTLADETGRGGYANIRDQYTLEKRCVIPMNEEEPEKMELAYLICDIHYDWEVQQHVRYGVPGENWDYLDGEAEGKKDRNGHWAGIVIINDTWSMETNDTWHIGLAKADTSGSYDAGLTRGLVYQITLEELEATGERRCINFGNLWEKWEHELPEEVIYSLVRNEEEAAVVNEYSKLYKDFVLAARAQMVTGVIDPNDDAQWANYLAELKANGEDELLEAAQSSYDRMNG